MCRYCEIALKDITRAAEEVKAVVRPWKIRRGNPEETREIEATFLFYFFLFNLRRPNEVSSFYYKKRDDKIKAFLFVFLHIFL